MIDLPERPAEFPTVCEECFAPPGCCCVTPGGRVKEAGHLLRGFQYLIWSYGPIMPDAVPSKVEERATLPRNRSGLPRPNARLAKAPSPRSSPTSEDRTW